MKIFKTIDKVLAGLGNIRAMRRTHVDHHTEKLINEVKGLKFAESEFGQIYGSFQELAGHNFLNCSIISDYNLKTLKGIELIFKKDKISWIIKSDTKEIESDYSNISDCYLTKIVFVVDEIMIDRIKSGDFDKVELIIKKKVISFEVAQF